jgi:DNA-binding MltR family transcriptional regulator
MTKTEEEEFKSLMNSIAKLLLPEEALSEAENYLNIRIELQKESERGSVLLAASYLENLLEEVLRKKLIGNKKHLDDLFDYSGPLGTFSSRISIAYSMGILLDDEFNDLSIIRKIRNDFSHKPTIIKFSDQKISSLCDKLKCIIRENLDSPNKKFITSVAYLAGSLKEYVHSNEKFIENKNSHLEYLKKIIPKIEDILLNKV